MNTPDTGARRLIVRLMNDESVEVPILLDEIAEMLATPDSGAKPTAERRREAEQYLYGYRDHGLLDLVKVGTQQFQPMPLLTTINAGRLTDPYGPPSSRATRTPTGTTTILTPLYALDIKSLSRVRAMLIAAECWPVWAETAIRGAKAQAEPAVEAEAEDDRELTTAELKLALIPEGYRLKNKDGAYPDFKNLIGLESFKRAACIKKGGYGKSNRWSLLRAKNYLREERYQVVLITAPVESTTQRHPPGLLVSSRR